MMQSARENRDLYYMALLPVTKREMVKARFSLVLTIEAMQVLVCKFSPTEESKRRRHRRRTSRLLVFFSCCLPFNRIFSRIYKHLITEMFCRLPRRPAPA